MKNLIKKTIVFISALAILHGAGLAQDKSIRGIVISSDSIPLINAEIVVKGSSQKILTDSMGNFQIVCKPTSKIKILAEGFVPLERKASEIGGEGILALDYDLGSKGKNKVIYDSEKMRNTILVNNREIDITSCRDIFEVFEGKVSGVDIMTFDGQRVFVIRGITSTGYMDGPLVIIDNAVIQDRENSMSILEAISPNDIRSIQVIKDGGELSLYGSLGSNGVIKVKTKKGLM